MRRKAMTIMVISLFGAVSAQADRTTPVSKDEAAHWVRHTVPRPKQIQITGKVMLPADQIVVRVTDSSDVLVHSAARELRETIGPAQSANGDDAQFTILLQLNGEGSTELKHLPNADQGYRIIPDAQHDELRLVALKPHGLYYAAKTLRQLLRANLADGKVAIPIVKVTDWPDIATRGLWGADAFLHVPWLSDRKYNHMEQIATSRVDKSKRATVALSHHEQLMVDQSPTSGINAVPVIVHLEHMGNNGVYAAYPDLRGKGEGVHPRAVCYSNPKVVDILADWIIGYAKMKNVSEIDLWLTENLARQSGCQCDKCRKGNRDLLELDAVLAAWKRAKQQFPDLKFWVLTSEETADSNEQILEVLPS
ncbi:MAG: glycoside hydrolase family 20 zincin-like fold domain-containing protein, partial [Planctomycetota bacterium]